MKKALISLTAASALMISTAAFAGGGKHKGPEAWFNKMDQNQDGKITQAEARAAKDEHFNRLDANGDGSLTPDELRHHVVNPIATAAPEDDAGQPAQQEPMFAGRRPLLRAGHSQMMDKIFSEKDANRDGKLTKAEAQMPDKRFEKLDTNGDGAITKAEWDAAKAQKSQKHGKFAQRMFQRLDTNGDGKVSRAEAQTAADEMFRKADANGDGVVTKEEMKNARGRHMGKHGKDGKAGKDGKRRGN